jgi:hypothetical protein
MSSMKSLDAIFDEFKTEFVNFLEIEAKNVLA